MMLLSIIIPTLNRGDAVIENIHLLERYIVDNDLLDDVEIIVSDNDSDKEEKQKVKKFVSSVKCKSKFYFQNKNIGFENNLLFMLEKCNGKFAMTLGDDDYLDIELFRTIISYLRTDEYKTIICNFYLIDENSNTISQPRDPIVEDVIITQNDFRFSSKAHQMSCLVFSTIGLMDAYRINCKSTLYPQVYFVGYSLSLGKGVHITRFPYKCTSIEKKNFDYHFDNLFGEICVAYDCLPFVSLSNKRYTIKYFLKSEYDRFINRNTFFHPIRFIIMVLTKYRISTLFKSMIIRFFIIESIKLPFIFLYQNCLRKES